MGEITLKFLQDLLEGQYQDVNIRDFEIEPGSKRGDNYTSMLYRITLKGVKRSPTKDSNANTSVEEPWQSSLIYKCLPESALRREAYKSDALFSNEIAFYTKILPSLLGFQKQHALSTPFKAIPKCFLAKDDLIILEDLRCRGFAMPDRRLGLSIEQCYSVLKVLAQFHALSLAMKYQNPEEFYELLNLQDGISEGFFISENEEWYRSYYRLATRNALAMVEQELTGRDDKEMYLSKFAEFCAEERFFNNMVELVTPQEPLAVISHGDCWTNNFLFRYTDGGEIAEVYLVDFQLARYASSALDVAYICYLCTSRQQRTEHLSSLLEYYGEELHKRLSELTGGCAPSEILDRDTLFDMLRSDFRRAGLFALGISVDMFPIMTCDSDEAPNLYQGKENDTITSDLVKPVWTSNEACRKMMTDLLEELVDNGIL